MGKPTKLRFDRLASSARRRAWGSRSAPAMRACAAAARRGRRRRPGRGWLERRVDEPVQLGLLEARSTSRRRRAPRRARPRRSRRPAPPAPRRRRRRTRARPRRATATSARRRSSRRAQPGRPRAAGDCSMPPLRKPDQTRDDRPRVVGRPRHAGAVLDQEAEPGGEREAADHEVEAPEDLLARHFRQGRFEGGGEAVDDLVELLEHQLPADGAGLQDRARQKLCEGAPARLAADHL